MSNSGYELRKEKYIHQSNGFNFGVPKEIEREYMWCLKCGSRCKTSCHIEDGLAFHGWCDNCGMDFFVKGRW